MKPAELFIGVIDLFAVLLPGAIVSFIAKATLQSVSGSNVLSSEVSKLEGIAGWIAFLIASYFFGHFVYLAGSRLDGFCDQLAQRAVSKREQGLLKLARRIREKHVLDAKTFLQNTPVAAEPERGAEKLSWGLRLLELVVSRRFEPKTDTTIEDDPINAFKMAKAILLLKHPRPYVDVLRLEADSKFFRSAVVVFLFLIPTVMVSVAVTACRSKTISLTTAITALVSIIACVVGVRLSFVRYGEQRRKAIELTYQLVLAVTAMAGERANKGVRRQPGSLDRAGG